MWFAKSLSHQVSALLVFIIFTVLLTFSFYFYNIQKSFLEQSTKQITRQLASSLTSANAKNLHFNDHYAAWIDIKNQLTNNQQQVKRGGLFKIDEIALLTKNGLTFAHNAPAEHPLQQKYTGTLPESGYAITSMDNIIFHWRHDDNPEAVRIYSNVKFEGRSVGTLILQLDLSLLLAKQYSLIQSFAVYIILVSLLAIIIGLAFGRWLSYPASIIEAALTQMGSGKIQLSTVLNRKDEYQKLALAVEQADKTLHRSEDQVHLLLDSTAEAIYGINTRGKCTFVNQACLDILGYQDNTELLGKNIHQLIHYSYADGSPYPSENCHIYRAYKKQENAHRDDEVFWRKDGSSFATEYWSHPIFRDDKCIGAVVTFMDITQRLKAKQTLRDRERNLSLTLDSIGDAVIVTDASGRITRMNKVAVELTGWHSFDACGKFLPEVFNIINAQTRKPSSNPVKKVLKTGKIVALENHTTLVRKDGSEFQIADSAAPIIDEDKSILGVILVFRDVTQQEQTEKALRRSQKMEAIGQLSGGIAHDFNNQLGIIIGYLDFLNEHLVNDSKAKKWVEISTNASMRCKDLTRQLLSFSRTDSNKKTVVDINGQLKELETMFARSVTPAISIQYFLADNLWATDVDPGEFQDAILNLIINARDAMPDGGQLLIETSNHSLDAEYAALRPDAEGGDYIQLALSDTGSGMSKETLDHVFDPFYTTKAKGKGTGLGMSMVYGFVKRFGGFVQIYSELNLGTTIRLYLPRSSALANNSKIINETDMVLPGGSECILIVDDEPDLLQLADSYLRELGYQTFLAGNAEQALGILSKEKNIELLFSDVVMPGGINGYELAQQATNLKPALKVLITSGFTSQSITRNVQTSFSSEILSKPYRKAELAQRIRLTLDASVLT